MFCTMNSLEFTFAKWLRWDRRCVIILTERGPVHWRPDVWGILPSRLSCEIEVKRTLADFRADADKPHIANRNISNDKNYPAYFWYGVPADLVERVKPLLPPWAGLITVTYSTTVIVPAPKNPDAKKLSVKRCIKLTKMVANQCLSVFSENEDLRNRNQFLNSKVDEMERKQIENERD